MANSNFFEQFYGADKKAIDASKKPFVASRLKRAYASAADNLAMEIVNNEAALNTARSNFENPDLNEIVDLVRSIEDAKAAVSIIAAEYKTMFGEELPS